jgi:hypothetical protein
LIDKLKKGQMLQIQGAPTIRGDDAFTAALSLADGSGNTFAAAKRGAAG